MTPTLPSSRTLFCVRTVSALFALSICLAWPSLGSAAFTVSAQVPETSASVSNGVPARHQVSDFDGDGKSDHLVFRGSGGALLWYRQGSLDGLHGQAWGLVDFDSPVAGDFDGDGKSDIAVWRNQAPCAIYLIRSADHQMQVIPYGLPGDEPRLMQDFDGDGKVDPTLLRNVNGVLTWYIQRSLLGFTAVSFGDPVNDFPVRGDFDGDGKADVAVYRRSGTHANSFIVLRSVDGTVQVRNFGNSGTDHVVSGSDFDGDGKTDYAVWRDTGAGNVINWYWVRSSDGTLDSRAFGVSSQDFPSPGDYDGDGKTDVAVWRQQTGVFYINASSAGLSAVPFGATGDGIMAYGLFAR
jgi:hypothetical protein